MKLPRVAFLLSARRLRAHGLIFALSLWSVYVWNMTTPGLLDRAHNLKGTDFLHFYTLGSLALDHRGPDLYSMEAQAEVAAIRVPAAAGTMYLPLYPPQVSIFFAPFARLPYAYALMLWLLSSTVLYAFCCRTVWRACPALQDHALTVFILALAFPAFWHLVAWGQTSALALACFTLAFLALRRRHNFLAGLALGCLLFKPQLGVAAAFIFLFTLDWKVIGGAAVSAATQLTAAWLYYGVGLLREWLSTLLNLRTVLPLLEPRLYQTHSLRTFWTMILPWPSLSLGFYLVSGVAVVAITLLCWRSRISLNLRYSALLLATVLLAPHLTVYDLVILAPAFLLISDWLMVQPATTLTSQLKILLYLAFVLPLIGPAARWTHFQLSVPVMAALLYGIWNVSRKSASLAEAL